MMDRMRNGSAPVLNYWCQEKTGIEMTVGSPQGESGLGPPIKTFEGDEIGIIRMMVFDTAQLAAGWFISNDVSGNFQMIRPKENSMQSEG